MEKALALIHVNAMGLINAILEVEDDSSGGRVIQSDRVVQRGQGV